MVLDLVVPAQWSATLLVCHGLPAEVIPIEIAPDHSKIRPNYPGQRSSTRRWLSPLLPYPIDISITSAPPSKHADLHYFRYIHCLTCFSKTVAWSSSIFITRAAQPKHIQTREEYVYAIVLSQHGDRHGHYLPRSRRSVGVPRRGISTTRFQSADERHRNEHDKRYATRCAQRIIWV